MKNAVAPRRGDVFAYKGFNAVDRVQANCCRIEVRVLVRGHKYQIAIAIMLPFPPEFQTSENLYKMTHFYQAPGPGRTGQMYRSSEICHFHMAKRHPSDPHARV